MVTWAAPDAAVLERLGDACALLGYSGDFAVVLLPPGYALPAELAGVVSPLEELRGARGAYFLFHVADAALAEFEGDVRVLARRGRTVLLWSPDEEVQLTPESDVLLYGIRQPQRISLVPKSLPGRRDARRKDGPGVEFDPLVADMAAAVSRTEYVRVWQALDDYETRYAYTSQNRACAAWIASEFASYGLEVEAPLFATNPERRNVIGTLRGSVEPAANVYVVAHFDSTSGQPNTHAPGADDNASGVAAVLEAARVLSRHQFRYTLKFVAFNAEEQGMVGSEAYVATIAAAGEQIIGCLNFDMIAYTGSDAPPPDLVIYTNHASLDVARVLEAACTTFVPNAITPVVAEDAGVRWSDHASFWDRGYMAVTGIEAGDWEESEFCPWYHTAEDRIEKYPQDYPTNVTTAAVAALAHLALPIPPSGFRRGDANRDGTVDLADAICTLGLLFGGADDPCGAAVGACLDAVDANDDGRIDLSDAIRALLVLFGPALPLAPPLGVCGADGTEDALGCESLQPCS